jgi:predicted DNA-binding transcriptional regulator AlpA
MKAFHLPPSAVLTHSKSTTTDQPEASDQIGFVPTTSICSTRRSQASHPKSDRRLKTDCLVPVSDRPRIVRIPELSARLGLRVSSLYVLIARGALPRPKPIVPGGRAVGWDSEVIEAWFFARKGASAEVVQ